MAVCLHLRVTGVYSVLYMGAEGFFRTLVPDSQVNSVPFNVSPTTSAFTRNLATPRKCSYNWLYILETWWKEEMFYNCLYLLLTLWTKEMYLQLSLSSLDFMNKGNVFTRVFIFWRLDEKRKCFYKCLYLLETRLKNKCFYKCLHILEIGQRRVMYLQLSLSTGHETKTVDTCIQHRYCL
jgi:hypothetical protein